MTTDIVPHTTYYFYRIHNTITDKNYIGVTCGHRKRKREHFRMLSENKHHSAYLQASYNKHGSSVFTWEILGEVICTEDYAFEVLEVRLITYFNSYNDGYNMSPGGIGTGNKVSCVWNGINYPSIRAAAEASGVHYSTMQERLAQGYICDEDMPGMGSNHANARTVIWNGIEYKSIAEAARANNLITVNMLRYVNNGWTSNGDINFLKMPCIWNGIEYESVTQAARALNITQGAMRFRVLQGYTRDSDMQRPPK